MNPATRGPVIAVTNQKGGVGKTTTAVNLAAALARKGKRTLLIDLDPQAHSSISFLEAAEIDQSIYDALIEAQVGLADVTYQGSVEGLLVAPARIGLAKLEIKLSGEFDGHYRLRDKLAVVAGDYDFVVIDTPPTLGLLTINALVASTHVIVPIQSSYLALEGTDDLLDTIQRVRQRVNQDLELLGVLVTMLDRRTVLGRDVVAQVREVFGDKVFKTIITRNVRLEESPAYKEAIFTHAPASSGAAQYAELGEEVLARV
ncbi:MAG: AAA family ATPase [Acidobacteria bacterium]|nr:AAA family ATPase [Acidobacteriota bacterium]